MAKHGGWRWFGVKTVYRSVANGPPRAVDERYDSTVDLLEERIVILKARGFTEAIRKARAEAKSYAAHTRYTNPYGERIRQIYLGECDAFELFASPRPGAEVFSATRLVSATTSKSDLATQVLGTEGNVPDVRRKRFFDSLFSGIVSPGAGTRFSRPARGDRHRSVAAR